MYQPSKGATFGQHLSFFINLYPKSIFVGTHGGPLYTEHNSKCLHPYINDASEQCLLLYKQASTDPNCMVTVRKTIDYISTLQSFQKEMLEKKNEKQYIPTSPITESTSLQGRSIDLQPYNVRDDADTILRVEDLQIATDFQFLLYSMIIITKNKFACLYCDYEYDILPATTTIRNHIRSCSKCIKICIEAIELSSKQHTKQQRSRTDGYNMKQLPKYNTMFFDKMQKRSVKKLSKKDSKAHNTSIMKIQCELLNKYSSSTMMIDRKVRGDIEPNSSDNKNNLILLDSPTSTKVRRTKRDRVSTSPKVNSPY